MVKEAKMKQTEIGLIPEDWEVRNLSELGQNIIGLTYSPNDVKDYGHLVLRSSNVQKNKLAFKNNVFVDMELPQRVIVKENDILICVRNGSKELIGKCALIDKQTEGSAFGAFMSVYRSEYSQFIFHQFQSNIIQKQIDEVMGATINQLTNKDLARFQIPLPPLAEQEAIATALSDCDTWIDSIEEVLAKKRLIKQGAMQDLLTPKADWEVKKLGEIINFKNGAAHENVVDEIGEYVIVNSKFISQEGRVRKYSNAFLCPLFINEIVMVMSDIPNGKALAKCFIIDHNNTYTLNQRICAFEAKENFNPKFLFYKINRNDYFLSFDSGSGQTNLRRGEVLNCPIDFPTYSEQTRIATILSDMDLEIEALEEKLNKARQIKQGMMQELLTGRVRLV